MAVGGLIGYRVVALGGSAICFLSTLLTVFAPNIAYIIVFLGVFTGKDSLWSVR